MIILSMSESVLDRVGGGFRHSGELTVGKEVDEVGADVVVGVLAAGARTGVAASLM